jgi:hypothetical protein
MNAIAVLAILPIIHFIIIYSISYKYKRLNLLKSLYALTYLDWIFVPFNFLIPLGIVFSWKIFVFAIILASIESIILHFKWKNMKHKPKETSYFADEKGFSPEGYTHLIFMSIQLAIVSTVVVSKAISSYYIILLALLLSYLVGWLIIILLIRKVRLRSKIENPLIIIGVVLLVIRIIVLYTIHY